MFLGKVKISSQQEVASGYFHLVFNSPEISAQARPGQFIHLRLDYGNDPLLRRPFSIHRVPFSANGLAPGDKVEILYRVVGKGTTLLSRKVAGGYLDVLGPLGKGFAWGAQMRTAILVAGGIGIAPLLFLAESILCQWKTLKELPSRLRRRKIVLLIGARTRIEILAVKEFQILGAEVKVITEDGSYGEKGIVTELLSEELFESNWPQLTKIFACGPREMLAEVANISFGHGIPCEVSLEENMACGLGICLGCVCAGAGGRYLQVCREGPVFSAEEIFKSEKGPGKY